MQVLSIWAHVPKVKLASTILNISKVQRIIAVRPLLRKKESLTLNKKKMSFRLLSLKMLQLLLPQKKNAKKRAKVEKAKEKERQEKAIGTLRSGQLFGCSGHSADVWSFSVRKRCSCL